MRAKLGNVVRWGPLVLALVVTALMWSLVDRWWPLVPLGYGPRWPWLALAFVPLVSGGSWRARLLATGATAAVVAWGLLGFRLPAARLSADDDPLRVVTFNAALKPDAALQVLEDAVAWRADLIVIVECSTKQRPPSNLALYRFASQGEICLWARSSDTPQIRSAPRDHERIGWSGTITAVDLPGMQPARIGVVHLRSVRDELTEFLDVSEVSAMRNTMAARHTKRLEGSIFASGWYRSLERPPELIVGDFNLVPESHRFRTDWHHWTDAWESMGLGTGYTWASRWSALRIDRILHDDHWRVVKVSVDDGGSSDHRPVYAELVTTSARSN